MAVIEEDRRDQIRLRLPADAAYGRIARIAATTLARRLGFGFRSIEDLGLALDETLIFLLSATKGGDEVGIEVILEVDGDSLAVTVTLLDTTSEGRPDIAAMDRSRFSELVSETVADWQIDGEAATVHLVARS